MSGARKPLAGLSEQAGYIKPLYLLMQQVEAAAYEPQVPDGGRLA